MVIFGLVCAALVVTCLYALKHKLLARPRQRQAAKATAGMALGVALLVCLFQFGFWAGVFVLTAMLMVAAIALPFLSAYLKQEPELR